MFCNSYGKGKYGIYCDGNWINSNLTCAKENCRYQHKELQIYDRKCIVCGSDTEEEKLKVCNKCASEYRF